MFFCFFFTHQRIQLVPPANKQSPVDAERGEDRDVVGFEDDFLYSKNKRNQSRMKHWNAAAAAAVLPPPLTSCWTKADQEQVLCRTQLVTHGSNHFPDGGGHGDADGGVGVVIAVDFKQDWRLEGGGC